MKRKLTHYAVARIGEPQSFQWMRLGPYTKDEAQRTAVNQEAMGNRCLVVDRKASDAIGLPEGWDYETWKRDQA